MDIRILEKDELIILHKGEIEKEKLDRCFREYHDMVKTQNTVFVVDENDFFVGIITLGDYLNNLETADFINEKCRKIISDHKKDAIADAWKMKQEFSSLKVIPVVSACGSLLYGIRIKDSGEIEKDIRDFEFWFKNNRGSLPGKYGKNGGICVVGEEPFRAVYIAEILKDYFEDVSVLILGDKEWFFREKRISEKIHIAEKSDLAGCGNLISVDVELYDIHSDSIRMLSYRMSEVVMKEDSDREEEKREIVWLHIGDILTPLEGRITAVQFFIISRILDVERRKDGLPFYWQNRFNEYFWPEMSIEEEKMMEKRVDLLIHSIKERGFSPHSGAGSVTEYPFGMNDGAHRTAFHAVYAPNSFLPYFIGNRSLIDSFWPYDGEMFFWKAGLPAEESEELKNRYIRLLEKDEVRTSLTGHIEKEYFEIFETIISKYGRIMETCTIKLHGTDTIVFRIKLKKQKLILIRKTLCSEYVEKLKRDLRVRIKGKAEISGSVTWSVKMENDLEKECMQELKFALYTKKIKRY